MGHQNLFFWIKDINAIARSRYIFIDDYCPVFNFIDPDDDTVLTQVWHAGVGFKSVGYARFGISGSPDPYQSAHRRYDYALVGNGELRDIYSEVFGIEQEALLATGMPRLDHFLDEERQAAAEQRLMAKYPWMGDGRVIVLRPHLSRGRAGHGLLPLRLLHRLPGALGDVRAHQLLLRLRDAPLHRGASGDTGCLR